MTDPAVIALLVGAGIVIALAIVVTYRVASGPTIQDRLLGVNVIGTSTVIVIAFLAGALDRPGYIDIALIYALLNFLFSLAVARFTYHEGAVR